MTPARGRDWLEANLPHRGEMNLLERIVRWDETSIDGVATSHQSGRNPLRRGAGVPIVAGIEYGAQAAAAHGALVSGRPSADGFLASIRDVRFHAEALDATQPIEVHAEQLAMSEAGVLYRFRVCASGRALVEGRLTVAFIA